VPEAEVNPRILNVGFGDVVYQSLAETAYIGRGPIFASTYKEKAGITDD